MDWIVSPKYLVKLVDEINDVIWKEIWWYKKVLFYIKRWHQTNEEYNMNYRENFPIKYQNDSENIDLLATINEMPNDIILKIAIDLWIETPDFLPSIPTFRNNLKENYKTSFQSFEKAFKQVEENPDMAVWLANSTLESIIKHILEDDNISINLDKKKTLYKLTEDILKEFSMFPSKEAMSEIKLIWSSLLNASKHIEELRSNKTLSHWKIWEDYIVNDSLYAYFIINSVSTIWMFLISFYNKKYNKIIESNNDNIDEISVEDIPF